MVARVPIKVVHFTVVVSFGQRRYVQSVGMGAHTISHFDGLSFATFGISQLVVGWTLVFFSAARASTLLLWQGMLDSD